MKDLFVGNNRLNGTLTKASDSFPSFSFWTSLIILRKLAGDIITNLSRLAHMDLSFDLRTFNFSSGWIPPFQLNTIILGSCKMGPGFPKWAIFLWLISLMQKFQILFLIGFGIGLLCWHYLNVSVQYQNCSWYVLISSFQQYVFRVDIYFQQYVSQSWTIIDLGINKFSGQYPRE